MIQEADTDRTGQVGKKYKSLKILKNAKPNPKKMFQEADTDGTG